MVSQIVPPPTVQWQPPTPPPLTIARCRRPDNGLGCVRAAGHLDQCAVAPGRHRSPHRAKRR